MFPNDFNFHKRMFFDFPMKVFVALHSIFSFYLLQVHQKCLHTSFIGHNHDNSFGSVPSWIIGSQRDQVLSVSIKASQCVALQKKK